MYSRPGSVVLPVPQQATQNHGIRSHIKQAAKGAARALNPRNLLQGRRGSQAQFAVPTIPASAYCNSLYLNSNATSSSMSIDSTPPTRNKRRHQRRTRNNQRHTSSHSRIQYSRTPPQQVPEQASGAAAAASSYQVGPSSAVPTSCQATSSGHLITLPPRTRP